MADTKYTTIPVSDPDEKLDPNASVEPEQHQCQNRRGWCSRWRAHCEGQENPNHRRWRIVRRIFFAFILIHLVKHVFYGRFRNWSYDAFTTSQSEQLLVEDGLFTPYDPTFEDPKFYGTDLADQDPVARELLEEFHYVFRSPFDLLDMEPNSFNDRWTDLESEIDPFDFSEDESEEGEDPENSEHPPHRKPHRKHRSICNDTELIPWNGPSKLTFSPDEFKSFALLLHGTNPTPAIVRIHQLEDGDATELITVNYTILIGDEKLNKIVLVSAYNYEGTYVLEINTPKHPPPGPPSSKHCIKVTVDVTFPAGLDTYGNFSLRLSHAIVKAHKLGDIKFENLNVGVGHGVLLFRHVSASNVRIGAAKGLIRGWFDVANNATFGTIKGASGVRVNPTGDVLRVKAAVVNGIVTVKLPADVYEGRFVLASLFGHPTITAPEPADVHVEKTRPNFKAGYYKTKTDSVAVLSARHGNAALVFE